MLNNAKTEGWAVGFGCTPETALSDFRAVQRAWQKPGGTNFYHYMIAFPAGESTPWETLDIAQELVGQIPSFTGHQMLLACHQDKEHLHTHILVNAVNEQTGKKLQFRPRDLAEAKNVCNEITRARGLSVPEKGKTVDGHERSSVVSNNQATYRLLQEAEDSHETSASVASYVREIGVAVVDALTTATSREMFIDALDQAGITTVWQDNRKHVTFTDRARQSAGEQKCKIRLGTLGKYYNLPETKEALEHELTGNAEREAARAAADAAIEAGRATVGESDVAQRKSRAAVSESRVTVSESTTARGDRVVEHGAAEENPALQGRTRSARGPSDELISAPVQTEEALHDETNILEFLAHWAVDVAERIRAAIENIVNRVRRRANQRPGRASRGGDRHADERKLDVTCRVADTVRDAVRDYRYAERSGPDAVQQAPSRCPGMGRGAGWER